MSATHPNPRVQQPPTGIARVVAMLARLRDRAMVIVRAAAADAASAQATGTDRAVGAALRGFTRAARAVTRIVALKFCLLTPLHRRRPAEPVPPRQPRAPASAVISAAPSRTPASPQKLWCAAISRMRRQLATHPLRHILLGIYRDLGITPDFDEFTAPDPDLDTNPQTPATTPVQTAHPLAVPQRAEYPHPPVALHPSG